MQNSTPAGQYHQDGGWQPQGLDSYQTDQVNFVSPYGTHQVQTPTQQYPSLSSASEIPYSYTESASGGLMTSQQLQALHNSGDILSSSIIFEPTTTINGSVLILHSPVPSTPQNGPYGVPQPNPASPQAPQFHHSGSYSQLQNYSPLNISGHHSLANSGSGLAAPTASLAQSDASLQSYAQYHNIYMQGQFGDAHLPAPNERKISTADDDSYSTFSGDITPPNAGGSTAPMTPSVGDDDLQPRRSRNPRRPRSAGPDPEDDAMAQHDISAQVVFQALKTVGQTVAMTNENLKLQNQLLAIQQRAGGAGSPAPGQPVISPVHRPDTHDAGLFQPPASKRPKPEPVSVQDAQNAIKQLEREEEAKINELQALRSKMAAYRSTLLAEGNWLSDENLEHRQVKKLAKNCYEAIYFSLLENVNGVRERFFVDDHPKPEKLSDLGSSS
jgi:hypothetical protein